MTDARQLAGPALADALRDSRATTRSRVDDLSDAQWRVPQQPGLNPIAWELAHLAWFADGGSESEVCAPFAAARRFEPVDADAALLTERHARFRALYRALRPQFID